MEHFFANFTGGTKKWHKPHKYPRYHGVLRRFNQKEFVSSWLSWPDGLAEHGWAYWPYQCADGSRKCRVHIFLHGCGQSSVDFQDMQFWHPKYNHYNNIAVTNDIIMIYP